MGLQVARMWVFFAAVRTVVVTMGDRRFELFVLCRGALRVAPPCHSGTVMGEVSVTVTTQVS